MKAVWIRVFGGPQNLEIRDVEDPTPVANEVRDDQRGGEEEQAEDEEQEPAVAFATRHPGGPEGDEHPDDQTQQTESEPAET